MSNENIQSQLADIKESLGFIRGTVTGIKESIQTREADHDKLEERVRKTESRLDNSDGRSFVLGSIGGAFFSSIVSYFVTTFMRGHA